MYCPRCGQQQISDQTKFCSRCGFLLSVVGEVLMNNGTLPQLDELNKKPSGIFTRRNGVLFSVIWTLFFLLIMAPFWGIADVDEMAAFSAVIGIFGGLILMIISLVALKKPTKTKTLYHVPPVAEPVAMYGHQQQALPPQQTVPANEYAAPMGSWRDTNELVPTPGSVTETTTKLLNKNE